MWYLCILWVYKERSMPSPTHFFFSSYSYTHKHTQSCACIKAVIAAYCLVTLHIVAPPYPLTDLFICFFSFSQNYSKLIPGTAVGKLSYDSRNVIQLILDAYAVSYMLHNSQLGMIIVTWYPCFNWAVVWKLQFFYLRNKTCWSSIL